MSMDAAKQAGRAQRAIEPLHSMVYFAPDAEATFVQAGLRPGRMCYFAPRAAPMGAVGGGPVTATFYNFNPAIVARHVPRCWGLVAPERLIELRFEVAEAALRRLLGDEAIDSPELAELAELTEQAATGCDAVGRPMYAAHADLSWPDGPTHLRLWHAVTLLREHRGDGHVAALVGHGLGGLDALVTHTETGRGFLPQSAQATRGWSVEEWDAAVTGLRSRGLVGDDGLTELGTALRTSIENETDQLGRAPWDQLGAAGTARVIELGKTFSRTVIGNGAFPPGVFASR
ncbi:MAG: SCO6745 family protein [Jatrophihabitans sp.]